MRGLTVFAICFVALMGIFMQGVAAGAIAEMPLEVDAADDLKDLLKDCACPRIFDPVCASDEHTYPNVCEFMCVQKKMQAKGVGIIVKRHGVC